jgi:myb proto-oncogene protein
VTHKPFEQKGSNGDNDETTVESNSSKGQEESVEFKSSMDNHVRRDSLGTEEKGEEVELISMDETNDLLNNYGGWWGSSTSLDLGCSWMNQAANTINTCYSSSFSLENSSNPSMGESPSLQEDSLQQWAGSVDSMLSWDGFNHLEQDFFFLENYNQ